MYYNWWHYFIPKICAFLSLTFNPIFIYLLKTDKSLKLGKYKTLLVCFSFFNMSCSLYDNIVPMASDAHRYAFIVWITEGIFFQHTPTGQLLLSMRCGFISVTYAILHAHFVYRYLLMFKEYLLVKYFSPYGLILTMVYCFSHMACWAIICELCFYGDFERKEYVREFFQEVYHDYSHDYNMVIALYWEASTEAVTRSWIGVSIVSSTSTASMSLYFILGYKIMKKLKQHNWVASKTTKKMQKQLFKALTVQTFIPIVVSLMPCLAIWFGPVLLLDISWVYMSAIVAVSIFPCLDPVAITCFLPALRGRFTSRIAKFLSIFRRKVPKNSQESANSMTGMTVLAVNQHSNIY